MTSFIDPDQVDPRFERPLDDRKFNAAGPDDDEWGDWDDYNDVPDNADDTDAWE